MLQQLFLGLALGLFYAFHSLLAADSAKRFVLNKLPERYYLYRLFYNLFAFLSLGAVAWVYAWAEPTPWWELPDGLRYLCWFFVFVGISTGWYAFRSYDKKEFLGLKQVEKASNQTGETLSAQGLNRYVRHLQCAYGGGCDPSLFTDWY